MNGENMEDYDEIMEAIISGDTEALESFSQKIEGFPIGKDAFVHRHWITNAIDCGGLAVVRWMLEKGAPVVFRDDEGYTVLHSAIDRDDVDKYEIVRLLIQAGADINAHGFNDWTPAHLAAVRGDIDALEILNDAGADFSRRTRIDWYATPLEEVRHLGGSPDAQAYLLKLRNKR